MLVQPPLRPDQRGSGIDEPSVAVQLAPETQLETALLPVDVGRSVHACGIVMAFHSTEARAIAAMWVFTPSPTAVLRCRSRSKAPDSGRTMN